jgi:chorismate-pyruvate lyase
MAWEDPGVASLHWGASGTVEAQRKFATLNWVNASSLIWLDQVPPILRTLLLSDGTVTKFLEAYYGEAVRVKTLVHAESPLGDNLSPLECEKGNLIVNRRIQMVGATTNRIYGLAQSSLRADILWPEVRQDLVKGRLGIGELMRQRRIETYRELLDCVSVPAGCWAHELGCSPEAPTAVRTYRIFAAGQPCLLITDRYVIAHFA